MGERGRTAEGSRLHGVQTGRWCIEFDGRKGSESTGRCVDMEEFKKIQRVLVMKDF